MMTEVWRSVPELEGYEVSSYGRYRSVDRYVGYRYGVRLQRGRVLKLHLRGRYLFATLHVDGKQKSIYIHRFVAMAFPEICGEWFEGCQVDHIDCNPMNNYACNLRVCTASQNQRNPMTLQHMSAAMKKYVEENGHQRLGKRHSQESIEKMKKSHTKFTVEELKEHKRDYVNKNRERYRAYWREYYNRKKKKKITKK